MDVDEAKSVFRLFAVGSGAEAEAYIPSAFLQPALHELGLFPHPNRVREWCRSACLPRQNEVSLDRFIELSNQLHDEVSMTPRTISRAHTHEFLAAVAAPDTRSIPRADIRAVLMTASSPLSTVDMDAVLDMLDPARAGCVDRDRLTQILKTGEYYQQHCHCEDHTEASVDAAPSSSCRLPLRTASASPESPHRDSRQRPSGQHTAPGSLTAGTTHTRTRRSSRRRSHGQWVDEDVAAASGARSRSHAVAATAAAHDTDNAWPLAAARVRPSRQRARHTASPAPDSCVRDNAVGATVLNARRGSHHTCSDSTDEFSVLVDPCSTPAPTRSTRARGSAAKEVHDPFDDPINRPRGDPPRTPHSRGSPDAVVRSHTASSSSSSASDPAAIVERERIHGRQKQRGDACHCCVAC